jgi:hypothetical protein
MNLGIFGKIPYAGEQGDFLPHQGIKSPCSAKSRDISHADAPPVRRIPRARSAEKIGDSKSKNVREPAPGVGRTLTFFAVQQPQAAGVFSAFSLVTSGNGR